MKLADVFKKYEGRFVVLQPARRDALTNKPMSFRALNAFSNAQEAVRADWYYRMEGFEGVFIYPCVESTRGIGIAPEHAARMFRVLYGRE
ncbi:MAG: hypothetical protein NC548_25225 [Lachnospiraceae bacterium]|nr:hypothetical protein [Lachnospiraceae bacterium]